MKQDKQPNAVVRLPRYSHDLSYDRSWTSSTGHIIPVVHDLLNAGETIECSIDLKTRMQPLLRPAMLDIHQKIKYFFVPMSMLYSLWEPIRTQVDDYFSSSLDKSSIGRKDGFPLFDLKTYFKNYVFRDEVNNTGNFRYRCGDTLAPNLNSGYMVFDQWHQGCMRLLDAFNMVPLVALQDSCTAVSGSIQYQYDLYYPNVFPFQLLAYQAVYFNYFRDEDYEQNANSAYNVDAFYTSSSAISTASAIHKIIGLRYVNRYKDFFMNVHPSPLLAGTSLLDNPNSGFYLSAANKWLYDSFPLGPLPSQTRDRLLNNTGGGLSDVRSVGAELVNSYDHSVYSQIDTSQLRLLFAVDKLLTVTGRARKRVDDQILAHFGFDVPTDVKHNIQYIGEQDGSFGVGDVISTADTGASGSVLGELAGKAYGVVKGQGVKKFTAPCDGVFLGVYYAMPKVRYHAGFDRLNAVANRTDLFIHEFDHLGMQPMFYYQLNPRTSYSIPGNPGNADSIYGWQWRYEQYKRKYNSVSLAFSNEVIQYGPVLPSNVLNAWTPMMRPDQYSSYHVSNFTSLKVTPHDLDNIMVMPFISGFDTTVAGSYMTYPYLFFSTDPFLHDMHVTYKKLSIMSTFSVPSLDNQI